MRLLKCGMVIITLMMPYQMALAGGPRFGISGGVGSTTSTYAGGEPSGGTYSINGATGAASFGSVVTTAKSTFPSINLVPSTAPVAPSNGDCWTTAAGLFCQVNGAAVGPYGTSNPPSNILPTFSGTCTVGTIVGNSRAGSMVTTASCAAGTTIILTFPSSATHGWKCAGLDETAHVNETESADTTSTCTMYILSAAASGDKIVWSSMNY